MEKEQSLLYICPIYIFSTVESSLQLVKIIASLFLILWTILWLSDDSELAEAAVNGHSATPIWISEPVWSVGSNTDMLQ